MNSDLKPILDRAIEVCVQCAFAAQSVKYADNPKWQDVVVMLDDITDMLRELRERVDGGS